MRMITRTCRVSGKEFGITADDLDFYAKMGIITEEQRNELKINPPSLLSQGGEGMIGLPTLCPEERQRRRLSWQNMRNLYSAKCFKTGKKLVSNYSSEKKVIIYDQEYWWSDKYDCLSQGIDFDFSKTFFENYKILMEKAPIPNLFTNYLDDENSKYTNFAGFDKNCYLIFHGDMNEDCCYSTGIKKCTSCLDGVNIFESELLYECVDCLKCYDLKFSQDCKNCSESWFLKNCTGCSHCFGCINLRNKEYYLFNKKVSREKYEEYIKEFKSNKQSVVSLLFNQFNEFQKKQFHRATRGYQNENCLGDHIFKSKNCQNCFDVQESRDMKFCERIYNGPNTDCYDVDQFGMKIQYIYETSTIGQDSYMSSFAHLCYGMVDSLYCQNSFNSKNCLGCFGIKNVKYAIFNKQYSPSEYVIIREKIIAHMKKTGEWGEFFPIELSPFGYNETVAQEYFPLKPNPLAPLSGGKKVEQFHKSPELGFKYKWKDKISRDFRPATIKEIPDDITDVDDSICKEILACESCQKNYQIQKAELRFYRKMNLPIPRKCPDCRHADRMKLRNPRQLFSRNCADCQTDIQTTFSPDRPEKVLCENCYLKVVD